MNLERITSISILSRHTLDFKNSLESFVNLVKNTVLTGDNLEDSLRDEATLRSLKNVHSTTFKLGRSYQHNLGHIFGFTESVEDVNTLAKCI